MTDGADNRNRMERVSRELAAHRSTLQRQPAALAGASVATQVRIPSTSFAIGDVVKCVAGAWTDATDADTGPLLLGVVDRVDTAGLATITVAGTRLAAGTAGTVYYVPNTPGPGSTTLPVAPAWCRVVEVQLTPDLRLVKPDVMPVRLLTVSTCDDGTPTDHVMEEGPSP